MSILLTREGPQANLHERRLPSEYINNYRSLLSISLCFSLVRSFSQSVQSRQIQIARSLAGDATNPRSSPLTPPIAMAAKKLGDRRVLDSVCSVLALVLVLVACPELCGAAATVVDVYRLIQYDISGAPFGSRLAGLNHHASSLHFPPGADLSRTVLIIPVRDLNLTYVKGRGPSGSFSSVP